MGGLLPRSWIITRNHAGGETFPSTPPTLSNISIPQLVAVPLHLAAASKDYTNIYIKRLNGSRAVSTR